MTIRTLTSYIDGAFISAGDQSTPVLNPANGTEIATAWHASADDVDRAVKAARRAFGEWSTATPRDRSAALAKLAVILEERAKELAEVESAEDCARFVAACHYPPHGTRSWGPARGLLYGGADYFDRHTDDIRIPGFAQSAALRQQIIDAGEDELDAGDIAIANPGDGRPGLHRLGLRFSRVNTGGLGERLQPLDSEHAKDHGLSLARLHVEESSAPLGGEDAREQDLGGRQVLCGPRVEGAALRGVEGGLSVGVEHHGITLATDRVDRVPQRPRRPIGEARFEKGIATLRQLCERPPRRAPTGETGDQELEER